MFQLKLTTRGIISPCSQRGGGTNCQEMLAKSHNMVTLNRQAAKVLSLVSMI